MFITSLTKKSDGRGDTFVGSCKPMILSTNHVVKEETKSQTWGATIPSMRKTNTLLAKLDEQMLKVIKTHPIKYKA